MIIYVYIAVTTPMWKIWIIAQRSRLSRRVTHKQFGFGPLLSGRRHGATGKDNCLKDAPTSALGSGVVAAAVSGSGATHDGATIHPEKKLLKLAQLPRKTQI